MSRLAAGVAAALVLATLTVSPDSGSGAEPDSAAAVYTALKPHRVLDTRSSLGANRPGDRGTVEVVVAGKAGVPPDATAVVANLTVTNTSDAGFVTAWPTGGPRPLASTINPEGGDQTLANLVTVPVGAGGAVSLYAQKSADLILDVQGYYAPSAPDSAGRLVPTAPTRVLDTREAGGRLGVRESRTIDLAGTAGVTRKTSAAVLKVTVDDANEPGFWTVHPAGQERPNASNLNVEFGGQTIANQVIVGLVDGRFEVYAQRGGHLVVDVVGSFTGPDAPVSGDGRFVAVTPSRLVDTRSGPRPGRSTTIGVPVRGRAGLPDGGVAAAVVNLTATQTASEGYFAAWASRRYRPLSSSLNASAQGQTIANHVVTPVSPHGFALFTQKGSHVVADISGYFTGKPQPAQLPPHVPLANPGAPPPSNDYLFSLAHEGPVIRSDSRAGTPVRWDPCRAIRYSVNYNGQRGRYVEIVREALDRLSAATGLVFTPVGDSAFMPTSASPHDNSPQQGFDRSGTNELIIAFGSDADTDLVGGTIVGRANVAWVRPGGGFAEWVLASVVVDTFDTSGTPDWESGGAGPVLLHELGHAVGLAHAGPTQLMAPIATTGGADTYQVGDRAGLWREGVLGGGCIQRPAVAARFDAADPPHANGWVEID